jgi:hypothetical protein
MNLSERGRNNITAQDVLMSKRSLQPLDNMSLEERSAHAVVAFSALAGRQAYPERHTMLKADNNELTHE